MCGRFTIAATKKQIIDHFGALFPKGVEFKPNYNVAPTQHIVALTKTDGTLEANLYRWGIVPPWLKEISQLSTYSLINAKSEDVTTKRTYSPLFKKTRCLIPADGFLEFDGPKGNKTAHRFVLKSRELFAFAGLWREDTRFEANGIPPQSCTILTTEPNDLVKQFHDRMPVVLPREAYDLWLDPDAEPEFLQSLCTPFPAEEMEEYVCPKEINHSKNNYAGLLEPE